MKIFKPVDLKKIRTALKEKQLVGFEKASVTKLGSSAFGKVGTPKVGVTKMSRA